MRKNCVSASKNFSSQHQCFYNCVLLIGIAVVETKKKNLILYFCRDKAIQSLQAILHKYDIEVGEERTRELEELRNALELQRKEFAVWKETIYEPQIVL